MIAKPFALGEAFTPKLITAFREGYGRADLRADALAGLTVAIVALPLAMALGIASGASPREGLVTAIIAGVLISALGGSRVQIAGPTAAYIVIVYGIVAQYGVANRVVCTIAAGVLLLAIGVARLGGLVRFIPVSIVIGFTNGFAVLILLAQAKEFLALDVTMPDEFFTRLKAIWANIGQVDGLPTTFIYDPQGRLAERHVGKITRKQIERLIGGKKDG